MLVLYVYCHPLDDSFHAAIRKEVLAGLKKAGHAIDLLDLYAEDFGAWRPAPKKGKVSRPKTTRAKAAPAPVAPVPKKKP